MRRVILESPFAGQLSRNLTYARRALRDCLLRGEAPFASHLLYTQEDVLDDNIEVERNLGIESGLCWGLVAEATVVYIDYGTSKGMLHGIQRAKVNNRPIEYRKIGENPNG